MICSATLIEALYDAHQEDPKNPMVRRCDAEHSRRTCTSFGHLELSACQPMT